MAFGKEFSKLLLEKLKGIKIIEELTGKGGLLRVI